ncbi:MAG: hypothetical protein N2484_02635 [Clostridia bacterium]|nr:hypothetical protein [Clostridia bacterium]
MSVLIVLLFIIPGFIMEFMYEMPGLSIPGRSLYRFFRGLAFNVPMTAFVWIVIWLWKVVLHGYPMISSLNRFWYKCMNEPFLLKYCVVLLVGFLLFKVLLILKQKISA